MQVTITDGAYGTSLPARDYFELWNLEKPSLVEAVAQSFVEAGSQVLLTNTFRAPNVQSMRAGVEIARHAAAGRAQIFGSIGPFGDYTQRAEALADTDAIVIETMMDLEEAKAAVRAARRTGLPVIASFFFGTGLEVESVADVGADVIGTNCGAGPEHAASVCRRLRAVTDLPIWIKPSPGVPGDVMTPAEFASHVPAWVEAGASYIGGCCGTTAAHIRAISIKLT